MTALEQIRARQQRAEAAYTQATEARRAAEAAESAARDAWIDAWQEAGDAERWLCLPKAAREAARSAPELVAAWRREHFGSGTVYTDTPTGTAARILHRRGREWCDALEVA